MTTDTAATIAKIREFVADDMLLRRFFGLVDDLTPLGADVVAKQDALTASQGVLYGAIEERIDDLIRSAIGSSFGGVRDQVIKFIFGAILAQNANELPRERRIVIHPADGFAPDEEHLALVHEYARRDMPTARWIELRDKLMACTRPAFLWSDEHEVVWPTPEPDAVPVPPPPAHLVPVDELPPIAKPAVGLVVLADESSTTTLDCDRCVDLGASLDEDGHACTLHWCSCCNGGTARVVGVMGSRAATLAACRVTSPSSTTPQMEAFRRAVARDLVEP